MGTIQALRAFFSSSTKLSVYDVDVNAHESPLNLDAIEQDLADVDAALVRLDADTYWTDEVTGEPLNEELLAAEPTARRNQPKN